MMDAIGYIVFSILMLIIGYGAGLAHAEKRSQRICGECLYSPSDDKFILSQRVADGGSWLCPKCRKVNEY